MKKLCYDSDDFPLLPKIFQKPYRLWEDEKYKFTLYKNPELKSRLSLINVPYSLVFFEKDEAISVLSCERLDGELYARSVGISIQEVRKEFGFEGKYGDVDIFLYLDNKRTLIEKYDDKLNEEKVVRYLIDEMIDVLDPYYKRETFLSIFK